MTLRPEQIKAREYFHHKGTLLPAAQIHERVAAAFAATDTFLASVSDDEARARALLLLLALAAAAISATPRDVVSSDLAAN